MARYPRSGMTRTKLERQASAESDNGLRARAAPWSTRAAPFGAALLVSFHRLPARFHEERERALGHAVPDEFLRRHALRLVRLQKLRHLAKPIQGVGRHGTLNSFLPRVVILHEPRLRSRCDRHDEVAARQLR